MNVLAAWNPARHLRDLFAPKRRGIACLDGYRGILSLWIIVYHTVFYSATYVTRAELEELRTTHWWTRPLWGGPAAVDGFFVLTGFLICRPLFLRHYSGEKGQEAQPVQLKATYFRRVARIWPVFAFVSWLAGAVLFPNGLLPISELKNEDNRRIYDRLIAQSGVDYWPSGCEVNGELTFPAYVLNFFFTNNLVPGGGCAGHSWSLSVQFQFYLLVPLIFKLFPRHALRIVVFLFFASVASRFAAFVVLCRYVTPSVDVVSIFLHFAMYMNTLPRVNSCLLGAIMAWIHVSKAGKRFIDRVRASPAMLYAVWLPVSATAVYFLCVSSEISTPGENFVSAVHANPDEFPRYAAYFTLFGVGSPVMSLYFALCMFAMIYLVGPVGRWLDAFCSHAAWHPIARLSYITYLLHPLTAQKLFATVLFRPVVDGPHMLLYCAMNLVVVFASALVVYLLVEGPCDVLLRQSLVRDKKKTDDDKQQPQHPPFLLRAAQLIVFGFCVFVGVCTGFGQIYMFFKDHPVQMLAE